jgi:hypothetical protein
MSPPAQKAEEKAKPRQAENPVALAKGGRNPPDRGVSEPASAAGLAFAGSRSSLSAAGASRPSASKDQSGSPPEAISKRPGLLVVTPTPQGDDQFSTLAAACAAAHNGDVIELQFDGPREDRPVKISNLRLTIRAAEGRQPVVVFRPTDANPVKYPHSTFTLAGGQLTLINVAVELHIPRGVPADNWSLLETWGGEMVRLERCALTVLNTSDQGSTYHQDVAFFRARPAPDVDAAVDGIPAATPLATIELSDCIVRGEADFLHVEDLQPVHLTWDNGLLVTTERLLTADGGQAAPKLDEMLRIELRHVTAVTRGGLCRLTGTSANPHQLPVQFVSTSSILMASPGVPLIEQEGTSSVEDFRQRFIWNGEHNFYQDVDVFWAVRNLDPETPPEMMNFEAWKTYWGPSREDQPSTERLLWKRSPEADRPLHAQGPAEYTLEDPTFGDASGGAPGCRADRLLPLPPNAASHTFSRPGAGRNARAAGGWQ